VSEGSSAHDALRRLRQADGGAALVDHVEGMGGEGAAAVQAKARAGSEQNACFIGGCFQGQRQAGRHQRDAVAGGGHVLVQAAQRVDEGARLAAERNHAQADLVAHQHHRARAPRAAPTSSMAGVRGGRARGGACVFAGHRHHEVGEPQREAVDHHQRLGRALRDDGARQLDRLLDGAHAGHALGAVGLVAHDALEHLVVVGLAVAISTARCRGGGEPVDGALLGAARLAALLAAEDEFVLGGLRSYSAVAWAPFDGHGAEKPRGGFRAGGEPRVEIAGAHRAVHVQASPPRAPHGLRRAGPRGVGRGRQRRVA
jgi:hypothetical protein